MKGGVGKRFGLGGTAAAALIAVLMATPQAAATTPDSHWVLLGGYQKIGWWGKPVWDIRDQEMVMVAATDAMPGSTWVYAGHGAWKNLSIPTPWLDGRAIAYDAVAGYVVLAGIPLWWFNSGGGCGSTPPWQTWAFYGNVWHKLATAHHPYYPFAMSVAYDPALGGVILFGGYQTTNCNFSGLLDPAFSSTWMFRGGDWAQLYPKNHPSERVSANLAAYPPNGWLILFGGEIGTTESDYTIFYNGTWAFEGSSPSTANWVLVHVPVVPGARAESDYVYDFNNHALLMAGGNAPLGLTNDYGNWNDTWQFVMTSATTGVWTNLHALSPFRSGAGWYPVDGHPMALNRGSYVNSGMIGTDEFQ